MDNSNDVCQSCGRGCGCNCAPIHRDCDCCGFLFSGDDGHLGDICPECGWECDTLDESGHSSANGCTLAQYARGVRLTPETWECYGNEDVLDLRVYQVIGA
jgi:hypothetical protein